MEVIRNIHPSVEIETPNAESRYIEVAGAFGWRAVNLASWGGFVPG
jgi:hypothetical protein